MAQAVLGWRAENNSPVGAVVSLDSTVDYDVADEPGFVRLRPRLAKADRLAGPILMYASKDGKPDFLRQWGHLKYTRLYTVAVPHLEHNDFITQGAARFAFLPGRNTPPEKGAAIRAVYDHVCLYTRKFFDAYLKGDQDAEAFLKKAAGGTGGAAADFAVTVREPAPLPPTARQLCELAQKSGIDAAIQLARRLGPEISEELLGDAAFALTIGERKAADGLAFLRLRCELFPLSWDAQFRMADQLLDDGDRALCWPPIAKPSNSLIAGRSRRLRNAFGR